MGLASNDGHEVMNLETRGPGEGLVYKTFDEEITFDKGGFLFISLQQLDSIVLSLLTFGIPTIQNSIGEK